MKISILLPYKENFSPEYPGAVSIFVKDITLCSKFKKNINIFGSTNYKKDLNVMGQINENFWNNKKTLQLVVRDLII